jgi:hypothetical protein
MRHPRTTAAAEAAVSDLAPYMSVIIEWPPPLGQMRPMPAWGIRIFDTVTGEPLEMVQRMQLLTADAEKPVTADLVALVDGDGNLSARPCLRDGEVLTGVFRVDVSEMRVRQPPGPYRVEVYPDEPTDCSGWFQGDEEPIPSAAPSP